ncbi:MAG: protein translocase subunit SecD [Cellvibrionaceae bacterium]|nr:protein translocase subunit SecD [Cellvibrionaceae bacterium]
MLNRYPLWKYCLILGVVVLSFLYASANLYAPDPAIQVSGVSSALDINQATVKRATDALGANDIAYFGETVTDNSALIRLRDSDQQLQAKDIIKRVLGDDYVVALNLAPTTPAWLSRLGASPMKLGLDLSGGVHFLMEVDTASVINSRLETIESQLKAQLREARLRYQAVLITQDRQIVARFADAEVRNQAAQLMRREYPEFLFDTVDGAADYRVEAVMNPLEVKEIEDYAVNQNLSTLRNRVNELGVSEPIVQRQGRNRIVVELPGVQDTAEAKRIIGKTANLEFRLEATSGALASTKTLFSFRDEDNVRKAYLEKRPVITGESVTRAQASFDTQGGQPQVNISLNSDGGSAMYRATVKNVGRSLGVLFIEYKTKTFDSNGELLDEPVQLIEKNIISLATIQSPLNADFRITGLGSAAEASELALLLRAGALAAPMQFVQESTIGPSLGAENIALGVKSVQLGLLMVLLFMLFYYKVFGFAANIALGVNLVLLVAVMSLFGATLTLPGIAGIVLTVGMAVDANVLIFSRIKEELANGLSPQMAIKAGFDRAFTTILDANLTTLIVALILYGIGTGPIKGFAVTLAIGILSSMFTAILGTRAIINLIYGGRTVNKLWI